MKIRKMVWLGAVAVAFITVVPVQAADDHEFSAPQAVIIAFNLHSVASLGGHSNAVIR